MKKIIATILSIVYLATSSGFTMYSHYCMDKLIGSSFSLNYASNSPKCNLCSNGENDISISQGCCKDLSKDVKLDKKQHRSDAIKQVQKEVLDLSVYHHLGAYSFLFPTITLSLPQINGPPLLYQAAVYLLNCVFLI